MKRNSHLLVLIFGLVLVACGSAQKSVAINLPTAVGQFSLTKTSPQDASQDLTRLDSQGAVTVEVKPENLSNLGDTLAFEISMSTHSVDLSMDLATLATLTTNDGSTVHATLWDAPRGGHHVSGTLSFPTSVDGKPILDGATKLTLMIEDVDAPERVFSWDLQK
jgi:hypothetical protein